jgi:hypothetical protein
MLAFFVALGVIFMPQMIGSANAQSERGSEQACPTGYILSQGRCTAEPIVTLECARIGGFIPRQTGDVCQVVGPRSAITSEACSSFGGTQYILVGADNAFCEYVATIEVGIACPGGITPSSGQCIVKPGQRDLP